MVALYIRVSTLEQAEEGYSIEEQENKLISYCNAKDWKLYKIYKDPGYSGSSLERPGIQNLINDARSGSINRVLVWKLDRLSRSQKDTMMLLEDVFLKNNCDFSSVCESFDTSTPFGRACIGILSVFAQLERENIRDRTIMGRHARIRKGHTHSTRAPLGYKFISGSNDLIIDEFTSLLVKEVFDNFINSMSVSGISSYMTKKYGNKNLFTWENNTSIRRILRNPIYIGKVKIKDALYDGIHQAIIDDNTFIIANSILDKNKELDKRSYIFKTDANVSDNLLTGLLYCGDCGARMYARKISTKTKKYICHSVAKTSKPMIKSDNCTNRLHPFTTRELENIILEEIQKLSLDKNYFNTICVNNNVTDDESKAISERIKTIDKQIEKILDLYQSGIIELSEITDRVSKAKSEKQILTETLNKLEKPKSAISKEDAWSTFISFNSIIKGGSQKEIHRIIHKLIDKIIVLNDDITIYWSF